MHRQAILTVVVVSLALAAGCEPDDSPQPDANAGDAFAMVESEVPVIQISPEWLDFGHGDRIRCETLQGIKAIVVMNTGWEDLLITGLTLSGSTALAVQVGADLWHYTDLPREVEFPTPLRLPPDQSMTLPVHFYRAENSVSGVLVLHTNDPSRPQAEVKITGRAWIPRFTADPPVLDFGPVPVSTYVTVPVQLRNVGDFPVEIYGLTLAPGTSAAFSVTNAETGHTPSYKSPLVILMGREVAFDVTFWPQAAATSNGHPKHRGILRFLSNVCPSDSTQQEVEMFGEGLSQ